jgi:hypothetical protein
VKLLTVLGSSLVAVTAVSAQGPGIVLVQQQTSGGKTTTSQVQMDRTHMRTETGTNVFIFDGEAQVARVIDMSKKTYMEMDKASMQKMQQQMSAMMEQLKNMPPEQKAMMDKMMKGRGGMPGMAPLAPITYRATGSDKAGQWTCSKYEGLREQQRVTEICTVEPRVLGLAAADFEVATQMAEFMKSMLPPQLMETFAVYGSQAQQGFSGYPIKTTSFSNGQVQSVSELKEVRREAIPASAWQVPAGFKREGPPR